MCGIHHCFEGNLTKDHPDYLWLFELLLASMLYHIDYFEETVAKVPGHPLTGLPVLQIDQQFITCEADWSTFKADISKAKKP